MWWAIYKEKSNVNYWYGAKEKTGNDLQQCYSCWECF